MKKKVLIVDDLEINRQYLAGILKDEYDILQAEDGEDGLEILKLRGRDISAVLLDIMMRKVDGYEVLKTMQKDQELSSIPVIVITAGGDEDTRQQALSLGATDFIVKPFQVDMIRQHLCNYIL